MIEVFLFHFCRVSPGYDRIIRYVPKGKLKILRKVFLSCF